MNPEKLVIKENTFLYIYKDKHGNESAVLKEGEMEEDLSLNVAYVLKYLLEKEK